MKTAPQGGHELVFVFDELQLRRNALGLQKGQRRGAQQLRKPTVEGAHLHRPPAAQQFRLQGRQPGPKLLVTAGVRDGERVVTDGCLLLDAAMDGGQS